MEKKAFLGLVEEVLEVENGSLSGEESLAGWDSLAVLSFIALVDEHLGVVIMPDQIANAKTLEELLCLLGDSLTN